MEKLIISCGGTGGHFMPGLSVARKFQEQGGTVLLFLGGKNAPKQEEIATSFGIPSFRFEAKLLSKNPFKMLQFLFVTLRSWIQCRKAIRKFQPDALLAMGSFASFAPVLASRSCKVPVFLHDGNARIGRANLILSRFARSVALSFPAVNAESAHCPVILTGLPLRPELISRQMSKADALSELNRQWHTDFSPEKPTILVFGGSLGAETINRKLVIEGDPEETRDLQFIRLTGPGRLEQYKELYAKQNCKVHAMEASGDMHLLYSAADLVICRSGGSTVSELAVFGKYALLLPYPYAADNHQEDNARWLAAAGGAEILHDSECSPADFTRWLIRWKQNREECRKKGEASRKLAFPDAPEKVISMIANIAAIKTN